MDKKQWRMLLGLLVGIVLLVGVIVLFTVLKEERKDVVKDASKETEQLQKETKKDLKDLMGKEHELLTWSEMSLAVEGIKEDLDGSGEHYNESDIAEKIGEKYGVFNEVAYTYDLVIDDLDDDFIRRQVMNSLLLSYYLGGYANIEDVQNLEVLRTSNIVDYRNSIQDTDIQGERETIKAIESGEDIYLFVGDTDGFHEGKNVFVGYPRIYSYTDGFLQKVGVEVRVLLDDDIKAKDFLTKIEKLDVEIGGKKANLEVTENIDGYIDDILEGNKDAGDKKVRDFYKRTLRYMPIDYVFEQPLEVLYNNLGITDETSDDEYLSIVKNNAGDITKYLDNLEDKILMKDTVVTVEYHVEPEGVFGGLDEENTNMFEHFKKDDVEIPTITVDGVEMRLSVATKDLVENKGIYFKK